MTCLLINCSSWFLRLSRQAYTHRQKVALKSQTATHGIYSTSRWRQRISSARIFAQMRWPMGSFKDNCTLTYNSQLSKTLNSKKWTQLKWTCSCEELTTAIGSDEVMRKPLGWACRLVMRNGIEGWVILYRRPPVVLTHHTRIVIFAIRPAGPCQKVEFFQAISCGNDQLEYCWYSKVKLYCQQRIGVPNFIAVVLAWVQNVTWHHIIIQT